MPASSTSSFGSAAKLATVGGDYTIHRLDALTRAGVAPSLDALPFSIKIVLESLLRNHDDFVVSADDVARLANWKAADPGQREVPFKVARVVLQDFTGVPCVVDLAAMRAAMRRAGGDPQKINPLVPVDLVIDHSVQVDSYADPLALFRNVEKEFERNMERYEFLKWGQRAFDNFGVVPPSVGIIHQVNVEHLAKVVWTRDGVAFPDTLVGTDSHTTMVNGMGVVGWGVGGIEAEACMLGQPNYLVTPQVVGFKVKGELPEGATATDLVLTVTQLLRAKGVVEKFVEFHGPGLATMSVADRATIANMAPEYGATMGFFPVDEQTLAYLRLTGRDARTVDLVERYCKEQGLWRQERTSPIFSDTLELDLSTVEPSVAGPKRPQDRVSLGKARDSYRKAFADSLSAKKPAASNAQTAVATMERPQVKDGDVVIAAITSCTNTSNPSVMVAAGLVAKKAVELGLKVPSYVKTSLAPGSRVVTDYLDVAGLSTYLDQLGFQTVGYGCTTCIGNSGPLPEWVSEQIEARDVVAVSVLSGNRNFEGRINPHVKANYLASPPLVVAYALAGTIDIDLMTEPLGARADGTLVYMRDLWPTGREVQDTVIRCLSPEQFTKQYEGVGEKNKEWNDIPVKGGELFDFADASTYIQEPPFFTDLTPEPKPVAPITGARVLVKVGDSVTTDHISPAGSIKKDAPAGRFLIEHGVPPSDFNSYGARRGDWRVMTRGTFANIRLKNHLATQLVNGEVKQIEGGMTTYPPGGDLLSIYDAAQFYAKAGTPLVVLAGQDYGMGSSRDWAAKGTMLLGVRAVVAESFERIHRANLVGMGVLPLQYAAGQSAATLGLTGVETFDIVVPADLAPQQYLRVRAMASDGKVTEFDARCRIDTPIEVEYYRNGGILHTVLRSLMKA